MGSYKLLDDATMDFFSANNVEAKPISNDRVSTKYEMDKKDTNTYNEYKFDDRKSTDSYYNDKTSKYDFGDDNDFVERERRAGRTTTSNTITHQFNSQGEVVDSFAVDSSYDYDSVPVESIKFVINKFNKKEAMWQPEFPMVLDGLVDRREYHQVMLHVNELAMQVLSKWCYSDQFIGSMFFTGIVVLVPYIPAIVLSVKREKKIRRLINAYLDTVNSRTIPKGYKWTISSPTTLTLELVTPESIPIQQRLTLIAQSQSRLYMGEGSQ